MNTYKHDELFLFDISKWNIFVNVVRSVSFIFVMSSKFVEAICLFAFALVCLVWIQLNALAHMRFFYSTDLWRDGLLVAKKNPE